MNSYILLIAKKTILTLLISLFISSHISSQAFKPDSLVVVPFGKVFIYKNQGIPQNIAIMISGDAGWKYGVPEFARVFSQSKTLVIGVDILRYYKELRTRSTSCYMVASDFVELATAVEKEYDFAGYVPPVIMGYSSGATLVYGILAQAIPGTFIGGISLGFCPDLELPKMLCQTNGLTGKAIIPGKSYLLNPDARLGNPWVVLQGKKDKICNYDTVAAFVKKTVNAELITIPETGHDFSRMSDFMPLWQDAFNRLVAKYKAAQPAVIEPERLTGIPYVITREKIKVSDAPVALFFSGDGGWNPFEQSIVDKLALNGIPTIGIDTKKYFWTRKSPDETTDDIIALFSYYSKEWGKTKLMLIGYSQGAEIVPFVATRLPDYLKSNMVSVVMLSPETTTDFEIHITNLMGLGSKKNIFNVIDEIKRMKVPSSLCIFGENEKTPVPGLLKNTTVNIAFIPGDHHYRFNSTLIVQTMKIKNAF